MEGLLLGIARVGKSKRGGVGWRGNNELSAQKSKENRPLPPFCNRFFKCIIKCTLRLCPKESVLSPLHLTRLVKAVTVATSLFVVWACHTPRVSYQYSLRDHRHCKQASKASTAAENPFPPLAMSVSALEDSNDAEIHEHFRPSSSASGFTSPRVLSGNVVLFPIPPLPKTGLPCPRSLTPSDAETPPVGLPATPQRAYRLFDRRRSPSPAPSYQSTPSTPPRTAIAPQPSSPAVNPFGTPYAPRYFENTPNGSIHRASSRTSTPSRFSSTAPRKLPPPPVFPDLHSTSPLNHSSFHERENENFEIDECGTDDDVDYDDGDGDLRSDFDYIAGLQNPLAEFPGLHDYANSEYTIDDDYDDELDKGEHTPSQDTRHYGPAPLQPQPRRLKAMAKKQVQLVQGNLVLDNPVPSKLTSFLPRRDPEFTHMRYTAATCDPDDFATDGYTLRPALLGRETQLFIAVTMYNEDEILFTRTMHGIMRNIAHLCSRSKSRVWGKDGWQKVVVCVVADGRREIHPRVLDVLAAMGVYQDGIAKNLVNGKEVKAHVYEVLPQAFPPPKICSFSVYDANLSGSRPSLPGG